MSIFSRSVSKSDQDKVDRAYDKKVGSDYSGVWSGSKSGSLSTVKDDFLMDIGAKEKTSSYYARLDDRSARSRESGPSGDGGGGSRSAPRKTARQEYEEMRAAALAKMRIEGQERRKKFEKEKGERVAALKKKRAKLLNI